MKKMHPILKDDNVSFEVTEGITIEEFNDKYYRLLKELKDKHGYITDITIHANSYEYNDGENYVEEINICYKRYESDEEFERRKNWHESMAIRQKENDLKKLKEYIEKYPEIATKYMEELNKK
jgi:hypothetical protein